MNLTDQLFNMALDELADAHLVLDRLGSPREIQEDGVYRECLLAERIKAVLPTPQVPEVAND